MAREAETESWLDARVARASRPRGAAILIASVTTSITLIAGLLMTAIDRHNFPTLGSGLWWAVQTVTTVGYGDVVPVTVAGRVLGAIVMLLGIGFVTVITASITSSFIARSRGEMTAGTETSDSAPAWEDELRKINERLEGIEAAVTARP